MPLLPDDVARLTAATGQAPERFARPDPENGGLQLRNVDGHCVFLGTDGCTVYADRPAGCRLYPLVHDADLGHGVLDDECPHRADFRIRPRDRAALTELVQALGGAD